MHLPHHHHKVRKAASKLKIKEITDRLGRDFTATIECEHCSNLQQLTTGYDDAFYHDKVIPSIFCNHCGLNRAGLSVLAAEVVKFCDRYLLQLVSRESGKDPKLNGYVVAEIPDWALKQLREKALTPDLQGRT